MPKLKKVPPIHDTLTGYDFREDESLSPVDAIRKRCVDCVGYEIRRVAICKFPPGAYNACSLWPFRMGRKPLLKGGPSPLRAIRQHCLWCCNGSAYEVRLCPVSDCTLWPLRFGHNPKLKGKRPAKGACASKLDAGLGIGTRTEAGQGSGATPCP